MPCLFEKKCQLHQTYLDARSIRTHTHRERVCVYLFVTSKRRLDGNRKGRQLSRKRMNLLGRQRRQCSLRSTVFVWTHFCLCLFNKLLSSTLQIRLKENSKSKRHLIASLFQIKFLISINASRPWYLIGN